MCRDCMLAEQIIMHGRVWHRDLYSDLRLENRGHDMVGHG